MREEFHHQLDALRDEILVLGSMVGKAIEQAIKALKERNQQLAGRIIEDDERINQKRFAIEDLCVELTATQQPMARDLRTLFAVAHMAVDLERMADHAEGIAKIVLMMGQEPLLKPLIDIPRMAERTQEMLRLALDAFVTRDVDLARQVAAMDDEVDQLDEQIYRELLTYMIQDPSSITRATYLLWTAHNLERMADHVTNLCEWTIYVATARLKELNV